MKFKTTHLVPFLLASSVIALVCFLQLFTRWTSDQSDEGKFSLFQRLELISYDWRVRLAAYHFPPPNATNLGFVPISDKTIQEVLSGRFGYQYGLYWPRHVYGCLVRELKRQGARAVGFDVLFGELRPDHDVVKVSEDGRQMTSDEFFARQLQRAGNVVLATTPEVIPPDLFRTNAAALGDITREKDPDGILRKVKLFRDVIEWSPLVLEQAKFLELDLNRAQFDLERHRIVFPRLDGNPPYALKLNGDGTIDLTQFGPADESGPQVPMKKRRAWNLGVVLAAFGLKLDLQHPTFEPGRVLLHGPNGVERAIPVEGDNSVFIDWSMTEGDRRLAQSGMERLLRLDSDRQEKDFDQWERNAGYKKMMTEWKERLVVVGSNATGNDLTDLGATPLATETDLVSRYWNVANSVLMNRFIHPCSLRLELALVVCLGYLAALLSWKLRGFWAAFWVAGLAAGYLYLSGFLFVRWRIWMPTAMPLLGGLFLNYVCVISYGAVFEQKERRRVRSVFAKIVSPEVVQELLSADQLSLGGAREKITVYFADVRGFTSFADTSHAQAEEHVRQHQLTGQTAADYLNHQAADTLATVNLYLSIIADTVLKHSGTLDKYIGDCVMAFWGAPVENPKHALSCVHAAIEAQRRIDQVNRERFEENERRKKRNETLADTGQPALPMLPILTVGTGINTGLATIGLMGSDRHILNYTVFGREVNLASRLEAVSGRSRIYITESTLAELQGDDPDLAKKCTRLAPVTMKGFREPVPIFEVPWRAAAMVMEAIAAETVETGIAVEQENGRTL